MQKSFVGLWSINCLDENENFKIQFTIAVKLFVYLGINLTKYA
jgi:hypothetical protein